MIKKKGYKDGEREKERREESYVHRESTTKPSLVVKKGNIVEQRMRKKS
jgi:hypothetical protein